MQHESRELVPLPLAAARLKITWKQAYDALLTGRLEGVRHSTRWFVTRRSMERFLARAEA